MAVVSSRFPGSEDKVAACPPTATSSTKKPVSTYWYPGADSKTSHLRCRPASWCTRDRRGPEPSAVRSAGGQHTGPRRRRGTSFPGPVHAWTIISLRFEHPARPGPPEARKSMAEVQPNKGHDRGGGVTWVSRCHARSRGLAVSRPGSSTRL